MKSLGSINHNKSVVNKEYVDNSELPMHSIIKYDGQTVPDGYEAFDMDTVVQQIILNKIYPIGSIYMSVNSTSPATFLGGTWVQLKDKFLLCAGDTYSAGSTGGEATHTLTIEEIPSHYHEMYGWTYPSGQGEGDVNRQVSCNNIRINEYYDKTKNAGGGNAHNNMPPYLTVYVWKRTV